MKGNTVSWIPTLEDIVRSTELGQDITHKQLFESLELYKKRYGKTNIEPRKWDDIVTEVKYGKGDSSKQTPRQAREDT